MFAYNIERMKKYCIYTHNALLAQMAKKKKKMYLQIIVTCLKKGLLCMFVFFIMQTVKTSITWKQLEDLPEKVIGGQAVVICGKVNLRSRTNQYILLSAIG